MSRIRRFGSLTLAGEPWSLEADDAVAGADAAHELVVTTVHDPPYMTVEWFADGSSRCSGYLYDLWLIMAKALNISFRMSPLPVGDYGTLHENGTWSGMVGELTYGRADIAVTTLDMTDERMTAVDYLDAYTVASVTHRYYTRVTQNEIPRMTIDLFGTLLKPLHVHVWWTLLASLLVLATALWITRRRGQQRGEGEEASKDGQVEEEEKNWLSCLFLCFMSTVGQGWASTPTSVSGRMVTMFSWILAVIIVTSYTANLISHLTTADITPPIMSLKDFSERPGWKLSVSPGHSALNLWKFSSDIYERELYQRAITGDRFVPLDITSPEMVYQSTKEQAMIFVSIDAIFTALGEEACAFVPVPYAQGKPGDGFMAMSKTRKSLRRQANRILLKMANVGLVDRLQKKWIRSNDGVCRDPSGYKELGLGDVFPIIMLMPLSLCFALVILCLERFLFWHDMAELIP